MSNRKVNETNIDLSGADDGVVTDEVINEDGAASEPLNLDDDIIDEDLDPLDRLPKEAIKNKDGTVTLPLHFPVTLKTKKDGKVRERVFDKLVFHRMVGADLRAVGAAPDEHQTNVALARSTKTNQAVMNALFDRMVDIDIANSGKVVNHFLASGPKAGSRG